jgi:Methane oxygenase PmoA
MVYRCWFGVMFLLAAAAVVRADANLRVEVLKAGGIAIVRPTVEQPLFVFNAPEDGRPYVHPMVAPDGKGALTEFSPEHHKHQTGIYVGFLKVNGRDYFHNRGADHFRRRGFEYKSDAQGVTWKSTYDLLDGKKEAQLTETQAWHFRDFTKTYLIDFTWTAKAQTDVTFDKYDYGGLFIRMPFKNQPGALAINSEGQRNGKAEGQKARWVDLATPVLWRVDDQLGVGPAPSRKGAWKLAKNETITHRYRFLVYTGEFQQIQVEAEWKAFSALK